MTCDEFRKQWEETQRGAVSTAHDGATMKEHLDRCADCRAYAEDMVLVREALAGVKDAPLPEEFSRELHLKLVGAAARRAPAFSRPRLLRTAVALGAVGVAVLAGFLIWSGRRADQGRARPAESAAVRAPEPIETIRIPANKLSVVRITFDVEQDSGDAEIEVKLPAGVVFVGEGGERYAESSMQWAEPLYKGVHEIKVLIEGSPSSRGEIRARAVTPEVEYVSTATLVVD